MSAKFTQRSNRPAPLQATHAYKTFAVRSPLKTHYRRATCIEVDCADYKQGWSLRIEGLPPELLHAAKASGRRYRVAKVKEGETYWVFEPGQSCFRESTHVTSLQRPEFFYAGRGDHRSFSTRRATQFDRPDQFVDSFEEHLARIRREIEKG